MDHSHHAHHEHHHGSGEHQEHDKHADHSVAMFKDKFWLSLILTIPVCYGVFRDDTALAELYAA